MFTILDAMTEVVKIGLTHSDFNHLVDKCRLGTPAAGVHSPNRDATIGQSVIPSGFTGFGAPTSGTYHAQSLR